MPLSDQCRLLIQSHNYVHAHVSLLGGLYKQDTMCTVVQLPLHYSFVVPFSIVKQARRSKTAQLLQHAVRRSMTVQTNNAWYLPAFLSSSLSVVSFGRTS